MGINFTHCNAQWAYSGFMRFRNKLAASSEMYEDGLYTMMKNEAIYPLINHSDGDLTVQEMCQIEPQLNEIVDGWLPDRDKENALELIEGMKRLLNYATF